MIEKKRTKKKKENKKDRSTRKPRPRKEEDGNDCMALLSPARSTMPQQAEGKVGGLYTSLVLSIALLHEGGDLNEQFDWPIYVQHLTEHQNIVQIATIKISNHRIKKPACHDALSENGGQHMSPINAAYPEL